VAPQRDTVLSRLGLDGEARFASLSGGWRRRALLARALVMRARRAAARRADQPPRHRGTSSGSRPMLLEFRGALLFVSHDRAFVNRIATRIVELDRGR
jgi:ATP-binding cassette subfamily F protein uup